MPEDTNDKKHHTVKAHVVSPEDRAAEDECFRLADLVVAAVNAKQLTLRKSQLVDGVLYIYAGENTYLAVEHSTQILAVSAAPSREKIKNRSKHDRETIARAIAAMRDWLGES